jgi:acetoin utilization protein AcuB
MPRPSGGTLVRAVAKVEVTMDPDEVVADLMTIEPIVIGPDSLIEDAERLMEIYDVTGLPVVADGGAVVGVISQTDLFREGTSLAHLTGKAIARLRVCDLMTSPAVTVEADTPLIDAARLMRDEKIHRVVAVTAAGAAVGVLSSMDFVALYAES